ncbi:uncharacterized protein LOC142559226 [Dermacentor variabilis]|uniref:uncharacterized protein LOC142559226 n=1 Tax=Dermacentor variabilis TaxID=34621 RepID=UPI003F5BB1EC
MANESSVYAETGFEVLLYVYDLSKGLAKELSPALLGKELPGVWHTSIVVHGTEYFFGSAGIDSCPAGKTALQEPDKVVSLGRTELPHDVFLDYMWQLGEYSYKASTYDLFRHNCNNFSQHVAVFLTGNSIPREILELPDDFLRTPMGSTLVPFLERLAIAVDTALGPDSLGGQNSESTSLHRVQDSLSKRLVPRLLHPSAEVATRFLRLTVSLSEMPGFEVQLYVYDLSKGLAKKLSPALLGKQLPGVWHTSIVVRGTEYFFGSTGIDSCPAGRTILQEPDKVISLGRTELPHGVFLEYIRELGESSYKGSTYNLFRHNCNNFSQDVALFLTGKSIPREILELPDDFLRTPMGSTLVPFFERLAITVDKAPGQNSPGGAHQRPKSSSSPSRQKPGSAHGSASGETSPGTGSDEERDDESGGDQPIFYPRVDGIAAFKELEGHLKRTAITESERSQLDHLREYLVEGHGAWALGPELLDLFEKLLTSHDVKCAARLSLLRVLQAAALIKDVILLLHQDRRTHVIMNYVNRIAKLSPQEQDEVLKLLCNLCSHVASCEWLLYITEWRDNRGRVCSNAKATVRAVVHGLLSDRLIAQEFAAALVFNLTTRELFDDAAEELAAAITQFLQGDLSEEQVYRALTALHRLLRVSYNEVSAKIRKITPYLQKLSGSSERVKKLVSRIRSRISASTSASRK